MNADKIYSIIFSLSVFLLPGYVQNLQAQPPQAPATTTSDANSSPEENSSLDLFDSDPEYTKQGWAQLYIAAGFMYLDGDGRFAARLPDGREVTIIDFDRAGLKDTDSSYWLSINWRSANNHWGAWFGSWQYDVTGSRIWEDSLPIGDTVIPVGASVKSDFEASWYILEATYSFYRSEFIDTGIGFGFHTVDIDTTLATRIQVGEQELETISTSLKTLAPLPNILAYFHWKFAPRWNLAARVGFFDLNYKNFSGRMTNAHAMASYQASQRWALGLGYQFVDLNLEVEKQDLTQVYDMAFSGPMAFARLSF